MGEDKYELTAEMKARFERDFVYHKPTGEDQLGRYQLLRNEAHCLAVTIATNTPPSREQSLALTALEQAIFYANAAIARNE